MSACVRPCAASRARARGTIPRADGRDVELLSATSEQLITKPQGHVQNRRESRAL